MSLNTHTPAYLTRHKGYIFRYTAAGTEETGLYAQYDIHVLLGSGSFANVFKVMQRSTGRWFAAKVGVALEQFRVIR